MPAAPRTIDPLLVVRIAAFALMSVVLTRTQADPDLWGHVLFGRDIVSARALPREDHYSFTSDRLWINHEWLSESAMSVAYGAAGNAGLVVLKLTLVGGVLAFVLWTLGRQPMPATPHDFVLFLTIAGMAPLANHIRPEMFSLLLFAALTTLLAAARERRRTLLLVPILMMLWVNVHGGWLVGMGTFATWAFVEMFTPSRDWADRLWLSIVLAAALLFTLVNPYGTEMWSFLRETVGPGRADITEWLPVYSLGPAMVVLWALLATIAAASIIGSFPGISWSSTAVVMMLATASFRVSRLIGFLAVSVPILLAPQIARTWQWLKGSSARPSRLSGRTETAVVTVAAACVVAAAAFPIAGNLRCVRIEPEWSPEPAAANFVTANHLRGRMLTWFNWGEYAIWHYAPAIKVSMDGRRETVYSNAVRTRHLGFFFGAPSERNYATELKADYIWVPVALPVVPSLLEEGWAPLFTGPVSIVLGRAIAPRLSPHSSATGTGCFPGP